MIAAALDYVRSRAKREWDYAHSRGLFARFFKRIGAMKPAEGVWVRQYADGDWQSAHCKGEVIQIWRYDATGFTSASEIPALDQTTAIASTTPVISFFLDEHTKRMIYQEWHGPRAGHGVVLALTKGGHWKIDGEAWIS